MACLIVSLIIVWASGCIFLAAMMLNDIRMVYNNLAPGARLPRPSFTLFDNFGRFRTYFTSKIDPDLLNETGRAHLKYAVRHEWIALAWMVGGFILVASAFSYSKVL